MELVLVSRHCQGAQRSEINCRWKYAIIMGHALQWEKPCSKLQYGIIAYVSVDGQTWWRCALSECFLLFRLLFGGMCRVHWSSSVQMRSFTISPRKQELRTVSMVMEE